MHPARTLTLLAAMAIAALALAAPAAFAQESDLESALESTGEPCPEIVIVDHVPTGGCPLHATSEGPITLRSHVFGVESTISQCTEEIDGRADANTEGYGFNVILGGANCNKEPCEEAGGGQFPWDAHGHENPSGPHSTNGYTEGAVTTICVASTADMTSSPLCNFELPWKSESGEVQDGGTTDPGFGNLHHYEGGEPSSEMAGIGTAGFRCEAIGHWMTEEPGTDLEINHTD